MWSCTKYRDCYTARERKLYRDPSDKLRDAALIMASGSRMLVYPATMATEQQLIITREIEKQYARLVEATKGIEPSDETKRTRHPKSRTVKKPSPSYVDVQNMIRRLHNLPDNNNHHMHHFYPVNFSDGMYEYTEYRNTWALGRRCVLVVDETVVKDVDVHEGQFSIVVPFHPENDKPETIAELLEQQVDSLLSSLTNA